MAENTTEPNANVTHGTNPRGWTVMVASLFGIALTLAISYVLTPDSGDEASHLLNAVKLASAAVGFVAAALGISKTLHDDLQRRLRRWSHPPPC